jgi:hypothetical protein
VDHTEEARNKHTHECSDSVSLIPYRRNQLNRGMSPKTISQPMARTGSARVAIVVSGWHRVIDVREYARKTRIRRKMVAEEVAEFQFQT